MKIKCDFNGKDAIFQRLYACLGGCKKGIKEGCRPLIRIDGCHLKRVYEGQLLTGIGLDANNETCVIAYAVVEMETMDSWTWFLELLAANVGIVNSHGRSFTSDRQKRLPGAFENVVPNVEHRFCAGIYSATT